MITYESDISLIYNTTNKFNYNKTNWELFQNCLKHDQNFISTVNNVEYSYNALVASYITARNISVPLKKGKFKHKYSPFWTPECSIAKKEKKDAAKNLRKNKNLNTQIIFKKCKANFKRVLAEAKQKYWSKFCSSLAHKPNLKQVWEIVNKLKGKNSKTKFFLKDSTNQVIEDRELTNIFAKNFENISSDKNLNPEILFNRPSTMNKYINTNLQNNNKIIKFKVDSTKINEIFKISELTKILKTVNINSSPGCDDIPFSFFVHSPSNVINYILNIINLSWTTNFIPKNWKTSFVNPILKPNKDFNDINSYRPISITTTISKIIEKMIVNRLSWYLEKNNLLNPNQSGFRKTFSTYDPIIRLNHEAEFSIDSGNYTIAIMIDFTRAFDLLWIDGLLAKLMNLGITGNMLNWIKNFLENRTNRVKIGNYFSTEYTLQNGTPQGSSLSPLLYLIMVNDFPKLSQFTSDAFFADDCTVWRSGTNLSQIVFHLQNDLDLISDWCRSWGLTINTEKTTGIIFTNRQLNINSVILKIDNKPIVFKNTCKLLGVIFDSHLTWKAHIDYLVDKSKKCLNVIRCVSGTSWGANKGTLITIYKAIILTLFDYCCFVYSNTARSNSKKLDTIQYKSLLIATGGIKGTSLNALLGECGELPLAYRRQKLTVNYLLKLYQNNTNSANCILNDKKFFQLEKVCKSKYKDILNEFLKDNNINISPNVPLYNLSPWSENTEHIDLTFLEEYSLVKIKDIYNKNQIINNTFDRLMATYEHLLFVDGSVDNNGKVGAAVYSPTLKIELKIKLPDHLSIYYAEAYAIHQSLICATNLNLSKYCVISDNVNVMNDIKNSNLDKSPHPYLIRSILNLLSNSSSNDILIKWMPGHSNHPYSDKIDHLAKLSASSINPINIPLSKYEALLVIDTWINDKWMKNWELNPKGSYQNMYEPTMKFLTPHKSRYRDVIINRLRLLHSKLNSGLFKIGAHETGKCNDCGVEETCVHFILQCSKTTELRKEIQRIYNPDQSAWSYKEMMSNKEVLEKIVNFVKNESIII